MRRRKFITLAGGAAIAWPLVARAQQSAMPVVGFLSSASPDLFEDRLRAFRQGLREIGYVDGDNITIQYRWAGGQMDRLPALAAELVRRPVTVIIASGGFASAFAAKAATTTIPIVFLASEDPVRLGLVASLARPGENVTGINFLGGELVAKRLEFLRELVPAAALIGVLVNPTNATTTETTLKDVRAAADGMGLRIQVFNASNGHEIEATFAGFLRERPDALFVPPDVFFFSRRVQLANLASRHAMPTAFPQREYADAGGLMSYGSSLTDAFRQVGVYAGRILKGMKPADLPVAQSTKLELVINAQTARMLGLAIPTSLLATADEVIE